MVDHNVGGPLQILTPVMGLRLVTDKTNYSVNKKTSKPGEFSE